MLDFELVSNIWVACLILNKERNKESLHNIISPPLYFPTHYLQKTTLFPDNPLLEKLYVPGPGISWKA